MRRGREQEVPLADRLTALRDAVEVADGRLPPELLAPARDLLAKAGARVALGDATVVALAGATGSGKSTLFNALAGEEVSTSGVKRPTTGTAHATVWGGDGDRTTALLDWLGVPRRHVQADPDPALEGLVLLDLPDHDSTKVEHRLEVDRLVQLVDVLVWVLDPQKYADAAVHDRYLAPYADHAGVLLVVLNQVDRLDEAGRRACLADLRALLDREGLERVPVLAASARTGEGLPDLRGALAERVAARRAATDRLAADAQRVAADLARHCAGGPAPVVGDRPRRQLVAALSDAAGVPVVTTAVERSVRSRGTAATGWPLLRWTRRLRPDPLRRLHLSGPAEDRGRTSLAAPSGVAQARVSSAVRDVREAAGEELPEVWRHRLRASVDESETTLAARLDRAVAGTDLDADRPPRWWGAVGALQWLLLLVALAGAVWLLLLLALGFLQLDDVVPVPRYAGFPLPTLLLVAGLLAGLLLALLVRPFTGVTARRRGRRARARLDERVAEVARTELLAPLERERAAHDDFCAAVARART